MMVGKRSILSVALAGALLMGCQPSQDNKTTQANETASAAPQVDLSSEKNKVSYTIGASVGKNLAGMLAENAQLNEALDKDAVVAGFHDALADKVAMNEEDMQKVMAEFQARMMAKAQEAEKKQAEDNKAKGEAFLAENAKKEGWKVTDSGLQYKVIEPGEGDSPKDGDEVVVHYKGTFIDGKQFDSSYDRQQPATFGVNQVIPGWTEALKMMKKGAKYQLAIPADIAYGDKARGPIPANSVLLFDVELLDIKKGKHAAKQEDPAPKQGEDK